MKATSDFISDEQLHTGEGDYKIWSQKGWGAGRWYLIRKSDRKVITSGDVRHCCKRLYTLNHS